jgi:pectate lyase
MKNIFFFTPLLVIIILACSASKQNPQAIKKLEIIRIESTSDHFVLTTKNESGTENIILAEKDSVTVCRPFKKFIIADSVHNTTIIKSGNGKDIVGFYLSKIDGINIRDADGWVKIIWNCNCFTDK